MAICGKALGVSWWMEPLGRTLEYSKDSLRRILKAPIGIFFWQTLCRILGQTLGQKPSGPVAPWVFRKPLRGPSICSLGSPLSTLRNLPRGSIHNDTPSAFQQIVSLYASKFVINFLTLHSIKYTCKLFQSSCAIPPHLLLLLLLFHITPLTIPFYMKDFHPRWFTFLKFYQAQVNIHFVLGLLLNHISPSVHKTALFKVYRTWASSIRILQ